MKNICEIVCDGVRFSNKIRQIYVWVEVSVQLGVIYLVCTQKLTP